MTTEDNDDGTFTHTFKADAWVVQCPKCSTPITKLPICPSCGYIVMPDHPDPLVVVDVRSVARRTASTHSAWGSAPPEDADPYADLLDLRELLREDGFTGKLQYHTKRWSPDGLILEDDPNVDVVWHGDVPPFTAVAAMVTEEMRANPRSLWSYVYRDMVKKYAHGPMHLLEMNFFLQLGTIAMARLCDAMEDAIAGDISEWGWTTERERCLRKGLCPRCKVRINPKIDLDGPSQTYRCPRCQDPVPVEEWHLVRGCVP